MTTEEDLAALDAALDGTAEVLGLTPIKGEVSAEYRIGTLEWDNDDLLGAKLAYLLYIREHGQVQRLGPPLLLCEVIHKESRDVNRGCVYYERFNMEEVLRGI